MAAESFFPFDSAADQGFIRCASLAKQRTFYLGRYEMKVGGVQVVPAPEELLVLERGEKKLVFRAKPVEDWKRFHALCPEPVAPVAMKRGEKITLTDDPGYLEQARIRDTRLVAYMVLESLKPSNIEWDSVIEDSPGTWQNFETDLKSAGLNPLECKAVIDLAIGVNSLDEAKVKAAREAFLLGQEAA
jgi:hypothetical protein